MEAFLESTKLPGKGPYYGGSFEYGNNKPHCWAGDIPSGQTPELWAKFLSGQAPVVQGLMGNYLEQSKNMFLQMQEQMAKQAETLFPGVPGFTPPKR